MNRLLKGNLIYMILGIVFLLVSDIASILGFEKGVLITQVFLIGLPGFFLARFFDSNSIEFLKLKKTDFRKIKLSILGVLLTYPIALLGNVIVMYFMFMIKEGNAPQLPVAQNGIQYGLFIILISILPGVFEEILFRGFFLGVFEKYGYRFSIFYTAFLFGIFHFNPYNLMGPMILGIYLGYVRSITGSTVNSMIAHGFNNFMAVSLGFLMSMKQDPKAIEASRELLEKNPHLFLVDIGIIAIVAFFSFKGLKKIISKLKDDEFYEKTWNKEDRPGILSYIPIFITIIIFIKISLYYFKVN